MGNKIGTYDHIPLLALGFCSIYQAFKALHIHGLSNSYNSSVTEASVTPYYTTRTEVKNIAVCLRPLNTGVYYTLKDAWK